jgi:CBS domain-containing protein
MDARTLSSPISTLNLNQPCYVELGTSVPEVISLMQEGKFGCVLVVDSQQQLVGIVTERDLLVKIMGTQVNPADVIIDEIMTPSPECLRASDTVAFALNLMQLGHYRHIPLVIYDQKDVYPVGIISIKDILNHVAAFLETGGKEE